MASTADRRDETSRDTSQTSLQAAETSSSSTELLLSTASAPQSRSASFKRLRRAVDDKPNDVIRASLPSLEDSIVAKLRQLQQLEQQHCCVVRQFVTSPRGTLVNRGDSFRKHKATTSDKSASAVDRSRDKQTLSRLASVEKSRRVLIIGDRSVGKTCLLQQFMTSQYMAAMEINFDCDSSCSKLLSVSLNGEETLVNFIDVQTTEQQEWSMISEADCLILIYSITDRKSFSFVVNILTEVRRRHKTPLLHAVPIVLVANKTDLVRKRIVTDREARNVCSSSGCKFIGVSAVLNHRVDDLLVGVVHQLRLQQINTSAQGDSTTTSAAAAATATTATTTVKKGILERLLFMRHKDRIQLCDNFTVL